MKSHDDPLAPRSSRADVAPAVDAQAPLVAPAAAEAASASAPVTSPADRRSALRVLAWTVGAGLLVSGLLEYQGWQIIFRTVPSVAPTIPLDDFVLSSLRTLSAGLGVGAGFGIVALLVPSLRRRPWRTIAAGVAVGTASFLGFMAWLVSLAP